MPRPGDTFIYCEPPGTLWEDARCSFCGNELKEPPAMWAKRKHALPLLLCDICWAALRPTIIKEDNYDKTVTRRGDHR